jgi:malate permease and related proteins
VLDYKVVFLQVGVLFMIIGVGVLLSKFKVFSDEVSKGISNLILMVTLPSLVIVSFQIDFSQELFMNGIWLLVIAFLIHLLSALLGKILFSKYSKDKKTVLRFGIVFSNPAFMGFPIMQSLFGPIGLFYCSVYVMVFNLFFWTYGVIVFGEGKEEKMLKKLLLNPGVFSVLIGTVLFYFSISLPKPIFMALDLVGGTTTPLAMLIVGFTLGGIRIKNIFSEVSVYYLTILRLVLLPLLVFFVLKWTDLDNTVIGVSVLATAMPVAASATIISKKYEKSPELASMCVFVSTGFSMITIPLLVLLL